MSNNSSIIDYDDDSDDDINDLIGLLKESPPPSPDICKQIMSYDDLHREIEIATKKLEDARRYERLYKEYVDERKQEAQLLRDQIALTTDFNRTLFAHMEMDVTGGVVDESLFSKESSSVSSASFVNLIDDLSVENNPPAENNHPTTIEWYHELSERKNRLLKKQQYTNKRKRSDNFILFGESGQINKCPKKE